MSMFRRVYGSGNETWKGFMERFPILFADRNKPMTETCMCWGIECPIGWYHILDQLCTALEFHNLEFIRNYNLAIVADQVKDKFGTLRFYYSICNVDDCGKKICDVEKDSHGRLMCTISNKKPEREERIASDYLEILADNFIGEAETMIANTCAGCGKPMDKDDAADARGWRICRQCRDKRDEKRAEADGKLGEEKLPPEGSGVVQYGHAKDKEEEKA